MKAIFLIFTWIAKLKLHAADFHNSHQLNDELFQKLHKVEKIFFWVQISVIIVFLYTYRLIPRNYVQWEMMMFVPLITCQICKYVESFCKSINSVQEMLKLYGGSLSAAFILLFFTMTAIIPYATITQVLIGVGIMFIVWSSVWILLSLISSPDSAKLINELLGLILSIIAAFCNLIFSYIPSTYQFGMPQKLVFGLKQIGYTPESIIRLFVNLLIFPFTITSWITLIIIKVYLYWESKYLKIKFKYKDN